MSDTSTSEQSRANIVVLLSGSGSNFQAFIDAKAAGQLDASLCAVISNKAEAFGLERARQAGIATHIIDHRPFASRELFDRAMMEQIDNYQPTLVILAGFMRILTAEFVQHYQGRLLNIHPSLLPKYTGLHTHQRAIDAGDSEAGATVHFVTEELDGGPPILQASVAIQEGDDADTLAARVLTHEHQIYPLAAQWFCQQRLQLQGNTCMLDGEPLPATGYAFHAETDH